MSSSRSRPRGGSPIRSSARRWSCSSPTRRATRGRRPTGGAPRRGTSPRACGSSSTPARRAPARSSSSSPPAPTPSTTRRSCAGPASQTYRATGRGYFGQQQVVDLLAYLRLLHNRYDDEALVTVLASPFVGLSNDALVLLRRAATKRPFFVPFERGLPADLSDEDRRLCQAFLQRFERLGKAANGLSLERLCERIVADHDYDLAVLAQWDGRRRYANMRKLARLARSYEELRGRDIEGFVRFVRDQEAVGARELEAVAEEEDADAVRLLTIHSAKGLEFKVVIVADAGRDRNAPSPDEILCLPDGRFGFRVADPATGSRRPAFGYEQVREAEREAERAERLRLYYVAMTRAIDRLIVSGAIDPGRTADQATPIGWVLARLEAEELDAAGDGPVELVRDGARLLVRVDRHRGGGGRGRAGRGLRSARGGRGGSARALRRRGRGAPAAARSTAARAAAGAGAAAPPRPESLLQRARALRPLLVPLLRRARGRAAGRGRARNRAGDDRSGGDRDRRRGAPAARDGRPRGPRCPRRGGGSRLVPGGHGRGARADPRVRRRRTASPSSPGGSPGSPAPCPSGPLRSSTTACSSTAGSTSTGASAAARSSSTTRRTRWPRARPRRSWRPTTGCSGSSTRSPA